MKDYSDLLKLAREAIRSELEGKEFNVVEDIKKNFSAKRACFVTLTIEGELRGCIGSLVAKQELWKDVAENARNAAFSDSRFESLSRSELNNIKIEISVLSVPEKISYKNIEELERKIKGKGVILKKGFSQATYLPQVWEQIDNFGDFISSLCEKAGLRYDAWKKLDLEVWLYDVEKIKEK